MEEDKVIDALNNVIESYDIPFEELAKVYELETDGSPFIQHSRPNVSKELRRTFIFESFDRLEIDEFIRERNPDFWIINRRIEPEELRVLFQVECFETKECL